MKPRTIRKQYLVDGRMQLSVALSMGSALLLFTGVSVGTVLFATADDLGPDSDALRRTGLVVTGAYFLLVFAVTMVCGVIATQRIAGPARVIEQAVRGMREGDWDRRLTLRRRDHLKSLAAELAALRDELRAQASERHRRDRLLIQALGEGRYDDALALCAEGPRAPDRASAAFAAANAEGAQ